MTKRKTAIALIVSTMIIWLIDRFSNHSISTSFGKIICGKRYMRPVDGVIGDVSCGFNADMYLAAVLFTMLLLGIALLIASKNKVNNKRKA